MLQIRRGTAFFFVFFGKDEDAQVPFCFVFTTLFTSHVQYWVYKVNIEYFPVRHTISKTKFWRYLFTEKSQMSCVKMTEMWGGLSPFYKNF